jgi:hypothetical protein
LLQTHCPPLTQSTSVVATRRPIRNPTCSLDQASQIFSSVCGAGATHEAIDFLLGLGVVSCPCGDPARCAPQSFGFRRRSVDHYLVLFDILVGACQAGALFEWCSSRQIRSMTAQALPLGTKLWYPNAMLQILELLGLGFLYCSRSPSLCHRATSRVPEAVDVSSGNDDGGASCMPRRRHDHPIQAAKAEAVSCLHEASK